MIRQTKVYEKVAHCINRCAVGSIISGIQSLLEASAHSVAKQHKISRSHFKADLITRSFCNHSIAVARRGKTFAANEMRIQLNGLTGQVFSCAQTIDTLNQQIRGCTTHFIFWLPHGS